MGTAPTMVLLVGLPAVGKTTRARALEHARGAIRLTPDDWLLAAVGDVHVTDKQRYAVEGRLLDAGVAALAGGLDVVVDFGLWSRDERTALRWIAAQLGARAVVEHLDLDHAEQLARSDRRAATSPLWALAEEDLLAWRALFAAPEQDELDGGPIDPAPAGLTWGEWAARHWPGLRVVHPAREREGCGAEIASPAMTTDRDALLAHIADNQQAMAMAMVRHRLQRLFDTRLTAGRLHALVVLDAQGPQAAGDLARALNVSAATVTGLVDGLVREGLAERRPDPADGRARIVHATPTGVQAWRDAVLGPTAIDADVLAHLTDDDLTLLGQATDAIRRAVSDVTGETGASPSSP